MSEHVSNVNKNELPKDFYKLTIYSRLFFIVLQVIFNHVIPDHQSDAFQSHYHLVPVNLTVLDKLVDFALGGYARWDGQYFLHISTLGYTHENCLAFFPAFPLLSHTTASYLKMTSLMTEWNAALLSSIIINSICFVLASRSLFQITLLLGADYDFARKTWQLFCISPATVFFMAPYSESLFSALTFTGIYYCMKSKFFSASVLLAFSAATRSNGLLNIGYLLFFAMITAWKSKLFQLACLILVMIPSSVMFFIPFLWFQAHAFVKFCTDKPYEPSVIHHHLLADNLTVPGVRVPTWCSQMAPFSYSAIQSTYWNVGFLRYFEWKQMPNFLLALPVLTLVAFYAWAHVSRRQDHPIFRLETVAFAGHSSFLAVFTFFCAHVQISTRMIGSSSPVLYWILAWLVTEDDNRTRRPKGRRDVVGGPLATRTKWVYGYCLSYAVIGTFLFVNHLPWT